MSDQEKNDADDALAEKTRLIMEKLGVGIGAPVQCVRTEHSEQSFWDSAVLCVANRADMTAEKAAQFADDILAERCVRIEAKR